MAARVVHKLQHHTLGVARWTASKAHTRGAVRRALAHPKQVVAQRRAVQSVQDLSSHDRGAARIAARHR